MVIAAKRASFCGFYHARNINMSPDIYLIVRGKDMEASASRRGVERERASWRRTRLEMDTKYTVQQGMLHSLFLSHTRSSDYLRVTILFNNPSSSSSLRPLRRTLCQVNGIGCITVQTETEMHASHGYWFVQRHL